MTMTDTRALIDAERAQLVTILGGLDDAAWATPSLCTGWTVRNVATHLLMPYELAVPKLLAGLIRAGFSFDRFASRWALADPRTNGDVLTALRGTDGQPFRVPGAGDEGELSHLACHTEDIFRPLGITERTDPAARAVVLTHLVTRKGAIKAGLIDGLALSAIDTDWSHGDGQPITGTTSALVTSLTGRTAALGELSGTGVEDLRNRL